MKPLSLIVGALGVNCYIPYCEQTRQCALIDPGDRADRILGLIQRNNLKPKYILLTHGHFDHIGAVNELREQTGAQVGVHPEDLAMLTDPMKNLSSLAGVEPIKVSADIMVEDGMTLQVGNIRLKAIHTPGHTRGGLCYLAEGVLFTGDTLFAGSVGRTDLPGGSHHTLIKSIRQKLFILEDDLTVFPGHGPISSLRQERISNPYLQGREELEWE
ncbi:MAG: MBL fold metallo-hydrolase [Caldicoprobacterales bacterium]|nr:MBL fold metallo-hydrolase [Clostridiales bacterium]